MNRQIKLSGLFNATFQSMWLPPWTFPRIIEIDTWLYSYSFIRRTVDHFFLHLLFLFFLHPSKPYRWFHSIFTLAYTANVIKFCDGFKGLNWFLCQWAFQWNIAQWTFTTEFFPYCFSRLDSWWCWANSIYSSRVIPAVCWMFAADLHQISQLQWIRAYLVTQDQTWDWTKKLFSSCISSTPLKSWMNFHFFLGL